MTLRRRKRYTHQPPPQPMTNPPKLKLKPKDSTPLKPIHYLLWLLLCTFIILFSIIIPQYLSQASRDTYLPAHYHYDTTSIFDNTYLTYGTDYIVASFVAILALSIITPYTTNLPLQLRTFTLLLFYSGSLLIGGLAHQNYTTVSSRNSHSFRLLWTTCVSCVTASSGCIGICASELSRTLPSQYSIPTIPDPLWMLYSISMTLACASGIISYQRPACDIFLAGVMSSLPSLYAELIMLTRRESNLVTRQWKLVYGIGCLLNFPLFFLYPIMVQYWTWSLGMVNVGLHVNVGVSWVMQAWGLKYVCDRLRGEEMSEKDQYSSLE